MVLHRGVVCEGNDTRATQPRSYHITWNAVHFHAHVSRQKTRRFCKLFIIDTIGDGRFDFGISK